ncbi:MAG: hypothetical protein RL653_549 [Pseudomonadota bacterium]|jgi:hypothetical protein
MSAREQPCEVALLEYAYGELSSAEAAQVERHVAGCTGCAEALAGMRGVRRVMAQLPEEPAPDTGLDSLLAYAEQSARRAAAGPAPSSGTWRRWLAPLLGAGALATLAFIALPVAERAQVPLPSTVAARTEDPAPVQKAALPPSAAELSAADMGAAPTDARPLEVGAPAPRPTAKDMDEGAQPATAGPPPARAVTASRANAVPGKGGAPLGRSEGGSLGWPGLGRGGLAGGGGGTGLRVDEAGPSPRADLRTSEPSGQPVRSRAKEAKQEFAPQAESEARAVARPAAVAAPAGPPPAGMDGYAEAKKAAVPSLKASTAPVAAREEDRAVLSALEAPAPPAPLVALRRAVGEAKGPAERQAALRRLCDAERATTPARTPGCEQLAREFPADGGLSR